MGRKSDMFKNRKMYGALGYEHISWRGKDIHLFGESHFDLEPAISNDYIHVWDVIKALSANANAKIDIILVEGSDRNTGKIPDTIDRSTASPTIRVGLYLKKDRRQFNEPKLPVIVSDMRQEDPFSIFEMLTDVWYFTNTHYYLVKSTKEKMEYYEDVFKCAKKFESSVLKHLNSSAKVIQFIESMVIPGREMRTWYVKHLHALGIVSTENPIKKELKKLMYADPEYYHIIIRYMQSYYNNIVTENSHFTSALQHMKATQRTKSPNLITDKYDSAYDIFIDLYTPIMDIWFMVLMREKNRIIILAGANHTANLSWYFRNTDENVKYKLWKSPGTLYDSPCIDTATNPNEKQWNLQTRKRRFINERRDEPRRPLNPSINS